MPPLPYATRRRREGPCAKSGTAPPKWRECECGCGDLYRSYGPPRSQRGAAGASPRICAQKTGGPHTTGRPSRDLERPTRTFPKTIFLVPNLSAATLSCEALLFPSASMIFLGPYMRDFQFRPYFLVHIAAYAPLHELSLSAVSAPADHVKSVAGAPLPQTPRCVLPGFAVGVVAAEATGENVGYGAG
jgi:hypothetical protein